MRASLVPLIAAVLLLGLVLLLPGRQAGSLAPGLALSLQPLDLAEPPEWAIDTATDAIERSLDRLYWGGHMAMDQARRTLGRHRGELRAEILGRLRHLGDDDAVVVARLIDVLGQEDLDDEDLIDELVRRAHSQSTLVAKSALRVLANLPDARAVAGIFPRLDDADPVVRSNARAALTKRARAGDLAARSIILESLAAHPETPDLSYLAACDVLDPGVSDPILDAVAEEAGPSARFMVYTVRLKHGHAPTIELLESWLTSADGATRINVMQAAVAARRVVGEDAWDELLRSSSGVAAMALADLLLLAVDMGHPAADRAMVLLEEMAGLGTGNASDPVLAALLRRHHPYAQERTRADIIGAVGGELSVAVDRVIGAPEADRSAFADLALQRLQDEELHPLDRLPLLRLLAHVDPVRGADPVVRELLARVGGAPERAMALLPLLDRLGVAGIERLAGEPRTSVVDALFVYAAAQARRGAALPGLERIVLDPDADPTVRREALDAIVRLDDGPREETLRRIVGALRDPQVEARARLLYWNYL